MKPPNQHEIAAVMRLGPPQRFEYLAKRVADRRELWCLVKDDRWVMVSTDEGRSCWPVWPAREYAEMFAVGDWSDCAVDRIELDEWLEELETYMTGNGISVSVFPLPGGKGTPVMPIAEFNQAIRFELSRIED